VTREVVKEYVDKRAEIENEVKLLREDMKSLDSAYEDKLDIKAVKAALRIIKLKAGSDETLVDSVIEILDTADFNLVS
jgi:uncharacterized protein (UPF0335 family)